MTSAIQMFDSHASMYDERWAKLAPMRSTLDFLSKIVLQDLPAEASVLCVGAGTGAELLKLALAFPSWKLTAVEPSAAMLEVCRRKAEAAGIAARCRFHTGFLDTLPEGPGFDAATSILVSQFLPDVDQRRGFFREIARRLLPGGTLITADLAYPPDPAARESLRGAWTGSLTFTGLTAEAAKASTSRWGTDVAVLEPAAIESILTSSGFEHPTLFSQSLFIHAWFARAPSTGR